MLETRLDNVVYRLGFAASRAQSRQLVRHGHFSVNGRRVNIPSYQVKPDDVVTMKSGSSAEQVIRDATDLTAAVAPWLQADHDGLTGKVLKWPERAEIDTPVSEQLIVELYSKYDSFRRKDTSGSTRDGFPGPEDHARGGQRRPRRLRDRAARPWLRLHVRQLAAPCAALLAGGRCGHLGEDRGRRARVHDPPGRPRGRHGHHSQPEAAGLHPPRRVAGGGGAA